MAFNVSSISAYVNQTAQQLIKKAVATGKTIDLVTIVPGIKYKETLNILDNTVTVSNATCGFAGQAGAVAFKQREIAVTALEVKEYLCEKTLEQYFMGMWMKAGTPKDEELGAILADSYVEKIKESNELAIWKGSLTTPIFGKFNGFVHTLAAEATRVQVSAITGPFTSSTIIAAIDKMVAAIPEAILMKNDLTLFVSMANYNLYAAALRTANLFHYDGNVGSNFQMTIPGTPVQLIATHGLTGTDYMVLSSAANLVVGTDLLNETEKFDIHYSQDLDQVVVNIQWKLGVQVYFPEFCVCNF